MKIVIKPIRNEDTDTLHYSFFKSQFGICLVASVESGICNILFADSSRKAIEDLKLRWPKAKLVLKSLPSHVQLKKYLAGDVSPSVIELCLQGTDFQIKVWKALTMIPFGKTATYKDIATRIGKPLAYRAVGTAIGNNPIGYFVPCHRILKSDGGIGGFRWGTACKQAMLAYEAAQKTKA